MQILDTLGVCWYFYFSRHIRSYLTYKRRRRIHLLLAKCQTVQLSKKVRRVGKSWDIAVKRQHQLSPLLFFVIFFFLFSFFFFSPQNVTSFWTWGSCCFSLIYSSGENAELPRGPILLPEQLTGRWWRDRVRGVLALWPGRHSALGQGKRGRKPLQIYFPGWFWLPGKWVVTAKCSNCSDGNFPECWKYVRQKR